MAPVFRPSCRACRPRAEVQPFHGGAGPALDATAGRRSEGRRRAFVARSKAVVGEPTIMPGLHSLDVGEKVSENLVGRTILTAGQVEDVVACLATLE